MSNSPPRLFQHLSPKIIPLFPDSAGETVFGASIQHAIDTRAGIERFTGAIHATISRHADGALLEREEVLVPVTDGQAEQQALWRTASGGTALGYAEIELRADVPLFWKVQPETGYALFRGRDGRSLSINYDMKYANYWVIEQIKAWGSFCVLHQAVLVDPEAGIGDSLLLINPYNQAIVVSARGEDDRATRLKLPPKTARFMDLRPIAREGRFSTVMLSGNNRFVTYDVRHRLGEPLAFNRLDHLDTFSGIATRRHADPATVATQFARRTMRQLGLRYV